MTKTASIIDVCSFCRKTKEIHSNGKFFFGQKSRTLGYQLHVAWDTGLYSIKKPQFRICRECLDPFHALFDADLRDKEQGNKKSEE